MNLIRWILFESWKVLCLFQALDHKQKANTSGHNDYKVQWLITNVLDDQRQPWYWLLLALMDLFWITSNAADYSDNRFISAGLASTWCWIYINTGKIWISNNAQSCEYLITHIGIYEYLTSSWV